MKTKIVILVFSILLFTSFIKSQETEKSQEPVDCKAEVQRISENFIHIRFMCKNMTNTLIFKGSEGAIVVDPGYSLTAVKLREFIKNKLNTEVKYVVNTHHHGDHTDANRYFPEAKLIDRSSLEKYEKEKLLKSRVNPVKNLSPRMWTMDFNGEEITFIPAPDAHSQTDLFIKFKKEKVLLMGDLLLTECFPAVSRNGIRYMEIMNATLKNFNDIDYFIGGHGKVLKPKGLISYINMLNETIRIVKKFKAKGWSYEKMQEKKILKKYDSYNHFLKWLNTDYWISSVYASFK